MRSKVCTIINNEGDLGWEEDIDGETNDMHKGQENLSMLSLLVLSAFITFRNFLLVLLVVIIDFKKKIINHQPLT